MNSNQENNSGLTEIRKHWRSDLLAAFSVALVAIPLGLGISLASNTPPMAGIITAIIGGILTTFIRGSHLAINGPGAGLIVVTLGGIAALSDAGTSNGWQYYMAAIIVAGAIQVCIGLLKWGKYADYLPSSVIRGMLAAIGVIIFASQIHIALGTGYSNSDAWESIKQVPAQIKNVNWPIAFIAINSLAILIIHPLFINRFKFLHYIPAPMLVLLVAIPFVFLFDLQHPHNLHLWGQKYPVGPKTNLISIPANFLDSFSIRPNWSKAGEVAFWITVVNILIISSVESLMSTKAIDKLDPDKRSSDLNKDLSGVGLSTMVAGLIGALPIISVIVRSSVNINHGAKTRWSNFYHGILVLIIVFFLNDFIQLVPLAALAAILVFTGYKLASPRMLSDTYKMGYEQLVIVIFTLYVTLQTGLISGLILGTLMTLLIHLVKSHIPVNLFFKYLKNPQYRIITEEDKILVKVKGVSNFTNLLTLSEKLDSIGLGKDVIVDFSQARVVDHSILELAHGWGDTNIEHGGSFNIIGLDVHITTSQHPLSLQVQPIKNFTFLSNRQQHLKEIAGTNHWTFDPETKWNKSRFRKFKLFENRSLEYTKNSIYGRFEDLDITFEICDITFDEGAFQAAEVHHATVMLIPLEIQLPKFVMEKETFFHKILNLAKKEEIVFEDDDFSTEFSIKGDNRTAIKGFFSDEMISFFMNKPKYHIESDGTSLFVFKSYRFSSPSEVDDLFLFTKEFLEVLLAVKQEAEPLV